jgi:cell division initiation protein
MRITPLDIQQMEFRVKMRGYDRREVRQFLEEAAEAVEMLTRENGQLRDKLAFAEAQLSELRKAEQTLSQALLTAQALTDNLKASAQRDADQIIKEAELSGAEMLRDARNELSALQRELYDLRKQRLLGIERLRSTLQTFARVLEIEEEEDDPSRAMRADKLADR